MTQKNVESMILESLVTTADLDGQVNCAPMGPVVNRAINQIILKPFHSSTTYANLRKTGRATVHVTDDVLLLAMGAIGKISPLPEMKCIDDVWWIVEDASRWFAVEIDHWIEGDLRDEAHCQIIKAGHGREFFGLNRAKHAVVEAAILATRLHLIPKHQVSEELQRLLPLVAKTGGSREHEAFAMLQAFIADYETESR